MKKVLILVFAMSILSCVDNEKEEAEMQERLKVIEEIDSNVEEINQKIDKDIKELEEALEELDSI